MTRSSINNARLLTVLVAAVLTAAVFAALPFTKVRFSTQNIQDIGFFIAVFGLISVYCRFRGMERLRASLEVVTVGLLLSVPMLVASYLAASLDYPLTDDLLMRWDSALGFDWKSFIEFIDARPTLAHTLALAYQSFAFQLILLPILLGLTGRVERAYLMICAYALLCAVSVVVSIWFPALGTYTVYGLGIDDVRNINAYFGFAFLGDFHAVRDQAEFVLSLRSISGIITFPSVHAAGALLCAWAAWDVKIARYPLLVWNGLMAISAVSHANHYLVDVLAGFAIAASSIALAFALLRWLSQSRLGSVAIAGVRTTSPLGPIADRL